MAEPYNVFIFALTQYSPEYGRTEQIKLTSTAWASDRSKVDLTGAIKHAGTIRL